MTAQTTLPCRASARGLPGSAGDQPHCLLTASTSSSPRPCDGLEPVEPGLVELTEWRPDGRDEPQTHRWIGFGGVARKPA
jgi:S-adenosyl methyltransferase